MCWCYRLGTTSKDSLGFTLSYILLTFLFKTTEQSFMLYTDLTIFRRQSPQRISYLKAALPRSWESESIFFWFTLDCVRVVRNNILTYLALPVDKACDSLN